jgi:hypothetical protein
MKDVEKFKKKFKFYINYPNVEELIKLLTEEISEDRIVNFINDFSDKIWHWMTVPNISFFT